VDGHHSVEDTGIVLGQAISKALGEKKGIRRFGQSTVPMDDALVNCTIDLSGRAYFALHGNLPQGMIGEFDATLAKEFFYALASEAKANIHFQLLAGENSHHIVEAMFKAFAKALDMAVTTEPRITDVLSTKGIL
jgi:imidazoleglycerol-phosphate dehydratase